jgi:hypothetical protein
MQLDVHKTIGALLGFLPSHSVRSITKVEVFDDKLTVTIGHGRTAGATCYLAIDGLRFCFTFDDLIKGIAVRTGEEKRARWPVRRHDYAPKDALIVKTGTLSLAGA